MDFYHAPGSSSLATYIMLLEADLSFRTHQVDIASHALANGSSYFRINPNGYVPALVLDDGSLLTESAALLDWVDAWPTGDMGRTRQLQLLAFLSTEIHKPFIPLFFSKDEKEQVRIRQVLEPRFSWISERMEGDYLFGDRFSAADAMLYVVLRWANMVNLAYPARLDTLIELAERRQSVQAALAADGLEPISRIR